MNSKIYDASVGGRVKKKGHIPFIIYTKRGKPRTQTPLLDSLLKSFYENDVKKVI
jgi:hypothetical protein